MKSYRISEIVRQGNLRLPLSYLVQYKFIAVYEVHGSLDSAVNTVTGLGAERQTGGSSSPGRGKNLLFSMSSKLWGTHSLLYNEYRGPFH
jgi:hypothetical protein